MSTDMIPDTILHSAMGIGPMRKLRYTPLVDAPSGTCQPSDEPLEGGIPRDMPQPVELEVDANLVTSEVKWFPASWHAPVIDIDIPMRLTPSTTPGHSHLYIDAMVPWEKYVALLEAMVDAGLVEAGYVRSSIARGFTAVRPPWVQKRTTSR